MRKLLLVVALFLFIPVSHVSALTCERIYYDPVAWKVVKGTVTHGGVGDLQVVDGVNLTVAETDRFIIYFNFSIPEEAHAVDYYLYAMYTGNVGHNVTLEAYNYKAGFWMNLDTITDAIAFRWYNNSVSTWNDVELLQDEIAQLRIIHYSPANPLHEIDIDYLRATAWVPTSCPPTRPVLPLVVLGGVVIFYYVKHRE